MHALIVHAHPEPRSFNAALKELALHTLRRRGHTVEVSDLYAQKFNPAEGPEHYEHRTEPECFAALAEQRHAYETGTLPLDVRREIARLERADLVIFQFPLWWHAQPAILKGWFDRVFVSGGLYTSKMRYDRGYFRGKRAVLSVTTGAPEAAFGSSGRGGDIDLLLWPIQYSLYYMGFSVLPAFVAYGVQGHGYAYQEKAQFDRQLERHKLQWSQRLERIEQTAPLAFPGWTDWDEHGRAESRIRTA